MKNHKTLLLAFSCLIFSFFVFSCKNNDTEVTTVSEKLTPSGSMFSDYQLHVLSVPDNAKLATSDASANGTYSFRTPSLRNLKVTAPYMHSGVFGTLDDILRFYGRIAGGNSQNSNVNIRQVDAKIRNIKNSEQYSGINCFYQHTFGRQF